MLYKIVNLIIYVLVRHLKYDLVPHILTSLQITKVQAVRSSIELVPVF